MAQLPAGCVSGDAGPGVDAAPVQVPDQRPRHGRPFGGFQADHAVVHAEGLFGHLLQQFLAGVGGHVRELLAHRPGQRPHQLGAGPGAALGLHAGQGLLDGLGLHLPRTAPPRPSPGRAPKSQTCFGDGRQLAADGGVPFGGQRVPVDRLIVLALAADQVRLVGRGTASPARSARGRVFAPTGAPGAAAPASPCAPASRTHPASVAQSRRSRALARRRAAPSDAELARKRGLDARLHDGGHGAKLRAQRHRVHARHTPSDSVSAIRAITLWEWSCGSPSRLVPCSQVVTTSRPAPTGPAPPRPPCGRGSRSG